jgi:YbgC/YbaW family acyl-CoA thioester hydrolase
MASEYRLRRRVQFYETDAAGIVHFSWFFRYLEEAEHALWRESGLSIHVPGSEYGFPRVSTSFDYHRALRFEQEFDVHIRVTAITKKSIQYTCELTDGDSRIASGTLTIVCVRHRPNEPMVSAEIPPEIRSRLQVAPGAPA